MKELGIYVHIPFCKQKCSYCDFLSFASKEKWIKEYITCLQKEIQHILLKEKQVTTIYIGGGTPSYLSVEEIKPILKELKEKIKVKNDDSIEWSIEVNPGTVSKEKLELYKKMGINRLSIGLQETDDKLLEKIGRIHTYEDFEKTYQLASRIGFSNINVDLIIGIPGQTIEHVKESLRKITELKKIKHISIYSLIVEENTKMQEMVERGKWGLPSEEEEREMYWYAKRELEKQGFVHYEISNFAKPGYQSKHNENCWKQKEYIGVGLGAHSYQNQMRYSNTNHMEEYIRKLEKNDFSITQVHEIQTKEDKEKEYMLLGLRRLEGISIQKFKQKFASNPLYLFRRELDKLTKEGLLEVTLNHILLTDKGLDLANLVWEEFV